MVAEAGVELPGLQAGHQVDLRVAQVRVRRQALQAVPVQVVRRAPQVVLRELLQISRIALQVIRLR